MEYKYSVTDIVKNNTAIFEYYKDGNLYYSITVDGKANYTFPIDITNTVDIGAAKFERMTKAIFLMRYINIAIKDKKIIETILNNE